MAAAVCPVHCQLDILTFGQFVQERFGSGRELFPIFQYGELQMKEAEVSVHPHVFNGKMHGLSAALETSSAGCAGPLAIAPVLLLEPS